MTDDPFQLGSPRMSPMTFWKTVWAVALGIILSGVLMFCIGLAGGIFTLGFLRGAWAATQGDGTQDAHRMAKTQVEIVEWNWHTKGFGNIMEASFTIANNSPFAVKDIVIKCEHTAPSGTRIDSNRRTIYEVLKAGEVRSFQNFSMGFIHSQVSSSSAHIADFSILP